MIGNKIRINYFWHKPESRSSMLYKTIQKDISETIDSFYKGIRSAFSDYEEGSELPKLFNELLMDNTPTFRFKFINEEYCIRPKVLLMANAIHFETQRICSVKEDEIVYEVITAVDVVSIMNAAMTHGAFRFSFTDEMTANYNYFDVSPKYVDRFWKYVETKEKEELDIIVGKK